VANMKPFDKRRVMEYIRIPRIKELCPNEQLHFTDKTLYIVYKTNDITYPDVGEMIMGPYGKMMISIHGGMDMTNAIEDFLGLDIRKRKDVINIIKDLSMLEGIEENGIEKIFEKYRNVLGSICELYKFCYLMVITFHVLETMYYKGKPTCFGKAPTALSINQWLNGKISKEQVFNTWPRILNSIDSSETITSVDCNYIEGYNRELKSDRFVNKKGSKPHTRDHAKLVVNTDEDDTTTRFEVRCRKCNKKKLSIIDEKELVEFIKKPHINCGGMLTYTEA